MPDEPSFEREMYAFMGELRSFMLDSKADRVGLHEEMGRLQNEVFGREQSSGIRDRLRAMEFKMSLIGVVALAAMVNSLAYIVPRLFGGH